jgi:uncharacterized membrane protein
VLLYLLGLTLTTVIGRWLWNSLDTALAKFPGLGMLYRTLKQVLGLECGEGALFQRVVLVHDQGTGGAEVGPVTTTEGSGDATQLAVFVPGSPNPAQGRLLRLPPRRKARQVRREKMIIFGKFSPLFSDLCGLCVFAGDIPILLVAALPR